MEYKKLQNNSENTFYTLDTDNDWKLYLNELKQTKLWKVFLKELKNKEIKKLNKTLYIQLESLKNKAKLFPKTIEAIKNEKNRKSKEETDLTNNNPLNENELKSAIIYNRNRAYIKPFNWETYKDVKRRYIESLFKWLNNFKVYVWKNKTLEELSIAVAIFQKKNWLKVDWKPGEKTRKKLFYSAKDISSSVNFRKNLITDYETRLIQRALKNIYPNILIDWKYWPDTLIKVRAIQKINLIKNERNWIPGTETLRFLNLLGTWEKKEDFYTHLIKYDENKIDLY